MLEINIQECKQCGSIKEVHSQLDEKIYDMARDEYNSLIYLSDKNHTNAKMKRLLKYKGILDNLFWNSTYYEYDYKTILSKIKTLL